MGVEITERFDSEEKEKTAFYRHVDLLTWFNWDNHKQLFATYDLPAPPHV